MKDCHNNKGKTIFVGIDVHKKTYMITVVCEQRVLKRSTTSATPEAAVVFLKKFFPDCKIKSCYEAGFSGFELHRHLVENGIDNIVVHPAHIETSARDRVKTDQRDSLKMATQLEAGRLRGVHVPDRDQEDRRSLTRFREDLVKERTRTGLRIKSHLMRLGKIGPDDITRVSAAWIGSVLEMNLMPNIRKVISDLIAIWQMYNDRVKEVTQLMKLQAKEEPALEAIYCSAPGIGPVAARILANELGDMHQFSGEKQLFSHSGFTPCEFSSGEHRRQGHITRQGKPVIRKIMVQAAWVAVRTDTKLKSEFFNLAKRQGAKRAIVAMARRLLGHLRACLKSKVRYRTLKISKAPAFAVPT